MFFRAWIILYMICQIIQIPIEKGVITDGGVPAYIHNSLEFKNRPDFLLTVETLNHSH